MGAGVGAAATGLRPVVDLMYVGFLGVCGDQILNNASKIHYMFGGKVNVPLTIMTGTGAGTNSAAQHSETVYSVFTHYPGLKVVVPSNPYNVKGLYAAAIRDDDPVIICNNRQLMGIRFDVDVPEGDYTIPIGKADIARVGTDITLVVLYIGQGEFLVTNAAGQVTQGMGQPGNTETVGVVDYRHNQALRPGHGDAHVDALLQNDFVPAPSCVEGGVLPQGLYHHFDDEGQVG